MGISQLVVALWLCRRPPAGCSSSARGSTRQSPPRGRCREPSASGSYRAKPRLRRPARPGGNTFLPGLIAVVVIVRALDRAGSPAVLPRIVARRMAGTAVVGALLLTAITVSAPYVPASRLPTVEFPVVGHSHDLVRAAH